MATAIIDGITTRYEVLGKGPPILMFSPGGFDATLDKWSTQSVYARIKLLDHLPKAHACIVFDRRETGQSGGRVERLTWESYARQGKGLLEHLGLSRAHVIGACMGCCAAAVLASKWPQMVDRLVLYWPVGGAKYRIQGQARFNEHAVYVQQHGLAGVLKLAGESDKSFGADPRGGPWVSVLRRDRGFADAYEALDPDAYKLLLDCHRAYAVRPRHCTRRRTGRSSSPQHPCAHRPRPGSRARDFRRALFRGVPRARGVLGCAGRGSDGSHRARANPRVPRCAAAPVAAVWLLAALSSTQSHRGRKDAQSVLTAFRAVGRRPKAGDVGRDNTRASESLLHRPRLTRPSVSLPTQRA